jgi:alpha-L-fucosidase 2
MSTGSTPANRSIRLMQPASRWEDALPTGNGQIGAMVYGATAHDVVLLNHEALWLRRRRPTLPDVSGHLSALRSLLFAGEYERAQLFLDERLREGGYDYEEVDPFQPAFDIRIAMPPGRVIRGYCRELDLTSGEVTVRWVSEAGAFTRQVFVSRVDGVVVMRIKADRGSFDATVGLAPHDWRSAMVFEGTSRPETMPDTETTYRRWSDGDVVGIDARQVDGTTFGGILFAIADGARTSSEGTISVTFATSATLVVGIDLNEPTESARRRFLEGWSKPTIDYDDMLARHRREHQRLMSTCDLTIGGDSRTGVDVADARQAADPSAPALIELLAAFGRYLFISSSRARGWPVNLQGVWNGDYEPAWSSDYHNDENVQLTYWQALPGGLPELLLPLFDYHENLLDDYRANARRVFGCGGIVIPICQSTHGLVFPERWVNWTGAAGWIAQSYYLYWEYTRDRTFLADRALPFMREVGRFYEDFLLEGPDGTVTFAPSLSPENSPPAAHGSMVVVNATMDVAIARELLMNLVAGNTEVGREDEAARWAALLARLPSYQLDPDGALREWMWPGLEDQPNHRHLSLLYPLFPGYEIDPYDDSPLVAAARRAALDRFEGDLETQTSWSLAHLAAILARLGDGERALDCLEMVARHCLRDNLLTVINDWRGQGVTMFWGHGESPPTNIDANCGITAAVLEMLCYSRPGFVAVLPGLPRAWRRGSARGIRCRGGVTVDLDWDFASNATSIRLEATEEQTVSLCLPEYLRAEWQGGDGLPDQSGRPTLLLQPGVARTVSAKLSPSAV